METAAILLGTLCHARSTQPCDSSALCDNMRQNLELVSALMPHAGLQRRSTERGGASDGVDAHCGSAVLPEAVGPD